MTVRRLVLDVDEVIDRPDTVMLATALASAPGVDAVNITVNEIDTETVGTIVTVVVDGIDAAALFERIERSGAVLHSIDEVVVGDFLLESVPRLR